MLSVMFFLRVGSRAGSCVCARGGGVEIVGVFNRIPVCLKTSFSSAQSDQGLYCPLTESLATIEYIKGEQRPG